MVKLEQLEQWILQAAWMNSTCISQRWKAKNSSHPQLVKTVCRMQFERNQQTAVEYSRNQKAVEGNRRQNNSVEYSRMKQKAVE